MQLKTCCYRDHTWTYLWMFFLGCLSIWNGTRSVPSDQSIHDPFEWISRFYHRLCI